MFEIITSFIASAYDLLLKVSTSAWNKIRPTVVQLFPQFGFYFTVYLIFCYIMYFFSTVFKDYFRRNMHFESRAKRLMVVIAHPDDECMFFGPLVYTVLNSRKCSVYVLCLSNGNADNKGSIRKSELFASCKTLGIPPEHVFLSCSSLRLDGNDYKWKSESIGSIISDYVESMEIDTVVTFDKYGVSGHENHRALFRAVSYLQLRNGLPAYCRVFLLDSVGIMRKYSAFIDSPISLLLSDNVFILSPYEHERIKDAMKKHETQWVWYRKLYMCFSRYTYVNTLVELLPFQYHERRNE